MLSKFFSINLPYGIKRNPLGEWTCFNREYMPLGYNNTDKTDKRILVSNLNYNNAKEPIFTKYKGLTESVLIELAKGSQGSIIRNNDGKITTIFLYNDGTNPTNERNDFKNYWQKLEILAKLKRNYKP